MLFVFVRRRSDVRNEKQDISHGGGAVVKSFLSYYVLINNSTYTLFGSLIDPLVNIIIQKPLKLNVVIFSEAVRAMTTTMPSIFMSWSRRA
jgi:hypothetical protein